MTIAPLTEYIWNLGDLLQRLTPNGNWATMSILNHAEDAKNALQRCKEFPSQYRIARVTHCYSGEQIIQEEKHDS